MNRWSRCVPTCTAASCTRSSGMKVAVGIADNSSRAEQRQLKGRRHGAAESRHRASHARCSDRVAPSRRARAIVGTANAGIGQLAYYQPAFACCASSAISSRRRAAIPPSWKTTGSACATWCGWIWSYRSLYDSMTRDTMPYSIASSGSSRNRAPCRRAPSRRTCRSASRSCARCARACAGSPSPESRCPSPARRRRRAAGGS